MPKSISEILTHGAITEAEIFNACREIEAAGHICILKMDGERQQNKVTVVVSFPDEPERAIRLDCDDLASGFFQVLKQYGAATA